MSSEDIAEVVLLIGLLIMIGFIMRNSEGTEHKIYQFLKYVGLSKSVLIITLLIMILACLFPPFTFKAEGLVIHRIWGFLFDPPKFNPTGGEGLIMNLDLAILSVEIMIIGLIGGVAFIVGRVLENIAVKRVEEEKRYVQVGEIVAYDLLILKGGVQIKLEQGTIQLGDTIRIRGQKTDFTQIVDTMFIEKRSKNSFRHERVDRVEAGQIFHFKPMKQVLVHDVVYKRYAYPSDLGAS